ncbi:hydantoinase B/oxoprolinase family protein [Psychromarinibacter halotolerans]|uniref:Hydantoinase B/oxoprolinase family protein n=1 Tax=Psychromarinibacter halotolerans TaxID=1775175 RepID=A0ABV7GN86_9RHOB|nr:hydantoinase B/oxoprolinase family protein [Psychromarinibacter halotolerans]MDF0596849.1 hydantoinase B/oxoprolinase family protein [Psychromarinibacter halotolerans]
MTADQTLDPITVEVIGNALSTVVEEMGRALMRASYSANIKERRDCSAAIFDTEGHVIAQAQQIPLHFGSLLGILQETVKRTDMSQLRPGDVFIGNDAFTGGGTHLNDIVFLEPVFYDDALVAWVANIAHHSDFVDRGHAHIFQEGLRIPPVKLYREGVLQDDVMNLVLLNCQVPDERVNDFRAQYSSNRQGLQRYQSLCERYGVAKLHAAQNALLDYAERKARAGITAIPDGVYPFECDFDTSLWPDILHLKVLVEVSGDEIRFDFDGCPDQTRSGLNMVFTVLQACVYLVVKSLIDRDTPANAGFHRPIRIEAPYGSIVNAAPPAAVYSRHDVAQRLVDMMYAALAQAIPERVPAASTGVTVQTMSGINPRTGAFYVYNESMGGGMGARATLDGLDGVHVNTTNSANIPVEALETEHPLRVEAYELVQDSGGPGRFRGGMAIRRKISPVGHAATANLGGPLTRIPAWGLDGGHDGSLSHIEMSAGAAALKERNGVLTDGQSAAVHTSGGGGQGDPKLRDRDLVRRDLREGRISEKAAKEIYGLE